MDTETSMNRKKQQNKKRDKKGERERRQGDKKRGGEREKEIHGQRYGKTKTMLQRNSRVSE